MEERLFISGTSTCLLITCLFIRKLLAVAGSTCCMQSVTTHNASSAPTHLDDESVMITTHNASSAPTHLDDESVMTSVVSNQKSEIVLALSTDYRHYSSKRKEDYLALAVHGIALIGSRTES